jgi:hypothetical protein
VKSIDPLSSRVGRAAGGEVRVHARLFGRNASRWIVFQKRIQQVKTIFVQARHQGFGLISLPFWERALVVRERSHSWPRILIWGAEQSEAELVLLSSSFALGRDSYLKILKISSISESPGKRGFRVHISAKMAPIDHISTPVEYCRPPSRISGERYHSVTT